MKRFTKIIATAGGLLVGSTAFGQAPVIGAPLPGFPNGTVVSGPVSVSPATMNPTPISTVPPSSLPVMNAVPVAGQPIYTTGAMPTAGMPIAGTSTPMAVPPASAGLVPGAVPGTWVQSPVAANAPNCCGPVGAHGPIGDETYVRTGVSIPFGSGLLAKTMDAGWFTSIGSRSLFFNTEGTAAWVVDPHISFTYNNAQPSQLAFLPTQPVAVVPNPPQEIATVRNVFRWAAGIGVGRDWYANVPGFVGGQWDAFTSYGLDVGGRWGTGHVDYQPISDATGYRRTHDVFGQMYIGGNCNINIPCGGWTLVAGARAEVGYTFSDISPTGGSFWEVNLLGSIGVRY